MGVVWIRTREEGADPGKPTGLGVCPQGLEERTVRRSLTEARGGS